MGIFFLKVFGGRVLYDDGFFNDFNGYFWYFFMVVEIVISSEVFVLVYEYSKFLVLDVSGMKIGEINDYKDIIR